MGKFDINRSDLYDNGKPELRERTKQRLIEISECGMEEVMDAEFGLPGLSGGLYIEYVWNYSDEEFKGYMDWIKKRFLRSVEPKKAETKFTKGEWKINHWETGKSGITYHMKDGNISYFSGDAVNRTCFNIVSPISYNEHNIEGSFEGAHIAEINDHSEESKANAKLIAASPEMYKALEEILNGCPPATAEEAFMFVDIAKSTAEQALKKATE